MRWRLPLVMLLALPVIAFPVAAAGTKPTARNWVAAVANVAVPGTLTVICYHEIRDDVREYPDASGVDSAALARQFSWLRENGYSPVGLDDVIASRQGGKPLPPHAVLLTFDDAYLSFYNRVYPLLREYRFPALVGVVGKWIDSPHGGHVRIGEKNTLLDASFPSWRQLREMTDSGLVEIASHTYDLHRGVPANPQGNQEPAATTRIYDAAAASYENDAAWRLRVRTDLARNSTVIEQQTGRRPRAVVWPYGSYNGELVRVAAELGMPIDFTLDDGTNTPDVPLQALRRKLIMHDPTLADFIVEIRGPLYPEPVRVVKVDLDDVYHADPLQQERNLSMLLDRIMALAPTHVYLRAISDAGGIVTAAYFPTRRLPVRADLFNRIAWQLATRNHVKVYALLPVTGFGLPQEAVTEIYEDLARHAYLNGLVFEDPYSAGARSETADDSGTVEFTRQLTASVLAFRAPLKTVRTQYVMPGQLAQDFAANLAAYDYVGLTPVSAGGNGATTDADLTALAAQVVAWPGGPTIRRRAIVMLDSGRFAADGDRLAQPAPAGRNLARRMRELQLGGMLNFGYSSDDFAHDNPPLAQIAPSMSLRVSPLATKDQK